MFWFFSNYFYNLGLVTTSVSSSTVLSNTSSIFVYVIALILMREKFHIVKGLFVLVSFGGIVIITLQDKESAKDDGHHTIKGDAFSVISALCYGVYATYLKIKVP